MGFRSKAAGKGGHILPGVSSCCPTKPWPMLKDPKRVSGQVTSWEHFGRAPWGIKVKMGVQGWKSLPREERDLVEAEAMDGAVENFYG